MSARIKLPQLWSQRCAILVCAARRMILGTFILCTRNRYFTSYYDNLELDEIVQNKFDSIQILRAQKLSSFAAFKHSRFVKIEILIKLIFKSVLIEKMHRISYFL